MLAKGVSRLRGLRALSTMARMNASQAVSAGRIDCREPGQLRAIRFQNGIAPNATGSTLIEWGNTKVICAVTVEEAVPRWMKEQNVAGGWITAEYSMLPYSTAQRKQRDSTRGKVDGRSTEIQRLIGRSLRAAVNLESIGSRTLWIDCDVLQADGGTRTAAITGTYVALRLAFQKLMAENKLAADPISNQVAAVSVGIVNGSVLLDLCYTEDAAAEVDMNVVMTASGQFIEVQGSGEESTFSEQQLASMLNASKRGIEQLFALQRAALGSPSN